MARIKVTVTFLHGFDATFASYMGVAPSNFVLASYGPGAIITLKHGRGAIVTLLMWVRGATVTLLYGYGAAVAVVHMHCDTISSCMGVLSM